VSTKQENTTVDLPGAYELNFTIVSGEIVLKLNDNNGMIPPSDDLTDSSSDATATPLITETPQATAMPIPTPSQGDAPQATALPESTVLASAAPNATASTPDFSEFPDPAGTVAWKAFEHQKAGIYFEVPKAWSRNTDSVWLREDLRDTTTVLVGWSGKEGSLYLCGGQYDTRGDVSRAADVVAGKWPSGVGGRDFRMDGLQIYRLGNDNDSNISPDEFACIVIAPPAAFAVNGKAYDTFTIWGTRAYVNHALKTLILYFPGTN
jgi:hypothetical protein